MALVKKAVPKHSLKNLYCQSIVVLYEASKTKKKLLNIMFLGSTHLYLQYFEILHHKSMKIEFK